MTSNTFTCTYAVYLCCNVHTIHPHIHTSRPSLHHSNIFLMLKITIDVLHHCQYANESLIKFLRKISNFLDQPPWSHFETNVTQKHKIKLVWPNVYRVQLQIIMTYGGIPPEYYIILHLGLRNYNQFYRVISEKINQYCQLFFALNFIVT